MLRRVRSGSWGGREGGRGEGEGEETGPSVVTTVAEGAAGVLVIVARGVKFCRAT